MYIYKVFLPVYMVYITYLNVYGSDAGNAFTQAAKINLQIANKHEAATQFVDAGNCYRKGDAGRK